MSAAVMKNPIEHALKHAEPCHQRPKGRANPTPAQNRRLRKNIRRLNRWAAEGRVTVTFEGLPA